MNQPMRFISAFSGVGGMDMGLENAGMECVAQIEWDKHCQNVLQYHWPKIPKWHDITTVNGADLPDAEVFAFGSPCQDLSVAGKRAGIDGARSSMFFEALRIIQEKQNATGTIQYVIWENVVGSLTSNNGHDFGIILDALAELGIVEIEWAVLDAQYFGIPQRRRRVFLVARFGSATATRGGQPLLPVAVGSRRNITQGRKAKQNNSRTLDDSIDTISEPAELKTVAYSIREDATANNFSVTETDTALTINSWQPSTQSHHAQIFIAQPIVFENSFRDGIRIGNGEVSHTLSAKMGTGGLNTPMVGQSISFDTQMGSNAGFHIDIAPTLKSSQQPPSVTQHNGVGMIVRRLTPLECERLQGWNDNHTAVGADGKTISDTQRFKMIGNGVASPVAEWVGKCVIEAYQWTEQN